VSFGGVHAVSGVSLEVDENSLHAIIGPNGAGKTTFFHLLTGVYKPTRGTIFFDGRDITDLGPAQRVALGIARSYQRTNIFPSLTVRENLKLASTRYSRC
jgi:branched-chain amino acid transport system ATP-binding protein